MLYTCVFIVSKFIQVNFSKYILSLDDNEQLMLALQKTCEVKQRAHPYLLGRIVSENQPDKCLNLKSLHGLIQLNCEVKSHHFDLDICDGNARLCSGMTTSQGNATLLQDRFLIEVVLHACKVN